MELEKKLIDGLGRSSSSRSFNNGNGVRQRCSGYLGIKSWNSRKRLLVSASLMGSSSQIAASAFTWGTVVVLPCYTFMVVAPHAHLTKKIVGSSTPYIVLGILYAYLLIHSMIRVIAFSILMMCVWNGRIPYKITCLHSNFV